MNSRTYAVGKSKITLRFGDITQSRAEVLVSSDDVMLSMGGGVSAALCGVGGPCVSADASKMVPASVGDVVVTTAGSLPAKYIFHAVTLGRGRRPQEISQAAIVRQTAHRAMRLLEPLRCRSIAFPAIGAGTAAIPLELVAAEMATALVDFVIEHPASYDIELYLKHRSPTMLTDDLFVFFEQFAARQLGLVSRTAVKGHVLATPPRSEAGFTEAQAAEARRRHDVYTMLRQLDVQRNKLEAKLLQAIGQGDAPAADRLAALRAELEQIQGLRRSYEAELATSTASGVGVRPNTVFVSSTSKDLSEHRAAARQAIEALDLVFVGMEDFEAARTAPADLIRQKVCLCEVFIGIIGMRYGSVDEGTGLSMTELEYHQAIASAKPIQMFVMGAEALLTAGMVETDPRNFASLVKFKDRIMKDHTCRMFTSATDLDAKLRESLAGQRH